nr:ABC transporter ATP-binding protein [uncultured Blautia sp.]
MASLLSVENLQVQFQTKKGINTAVDGVSFSIEKGRILGIVGESGCGKSVTSMSILQLLSSNARISGGSIKLDGKELIGLPEKEMCRIRGNDIAMIFQDPMTALNPTLTIGNQLMEPIMLHQNCGKKEAWVRAVDVLKRVGIAAPEKRMKEYPHQLSGGMRQRVMIAMAVSCEPRLLIADEPTTALDVTIQAQILELMCELREKMGTAIMLITHDMGVVAETADDVLVLYAGKAVEYGSIEDIFEKPKHPYTQGLLNSIPRLDEDVEMLNTIEGTVPAPGAMPAGCRFAPRCPYGKERCMKEKPGVYHVENSLVSCFRYEGEK